jgi:tetratricopeptide (TPR) repeat protein
VFAPSVSVSSCARAATVVMLVLAPAVGQAQRRGPVEAIAAESDQAFEGKRFGDALEAYTKALALTPEDASLWLGKGLPALMLGQSDVAAASLARAVTLKPRMVQAAILLGELQYEGDRVAERAARASMPGGDAVAEDAVVIETPHVLDTARPRVTVRVYSSTSIAADAQRASLDVATAIFAAASIQIVWKICGEVACETPLSATELAVRMAQLSNGDDRGDHQLGEALIDPQKRTGVLATVYVNRTLKLARALKINHQILLGHTVAHEIGHLLLATNSHAASGLMREFWLRDELRRTRRDDWDFDPFDAAAILERLRQIVRPAWPNENSGQL